MDNVGLKSGNSENRKMEIREITHSYRKCRSGFPTAMVETGKSSYAKASEDNNPTEPLCVGGSLLHIQERNTRLEASPIKASSVVPLCGKFPILSLVHSLMSSFSCLKSELSLIT